ncbi:metal ABC transporter solute-binding protein, Zn/Mn family [Candidatus Symbiobacter mobilis]|uniref:ABC-type zinc/manganese transporter substrate-binding protein n=1 Tax=Candidatus Symbiobacter mobilis CR TaxID=946483 RepID=U5N7A1_9BURK|nr:zinc ABC transporter substrate-binding protein [Candidatus Symbiobacter mobilis]AGX87185.1 ABC-type zinc/manganese transporter substrate-binding protein [Candidatus Symbiobacter mobilis CR]
MLWQCWKQWMVGLCALLVSMAWGAASKPVPMSEPIPVVASFSILGDVVRVVGADRIAVTNLVGPSQDAHTFEPRPTHARALLASRLVVLHGMELEPWAQKLLRSSGYSGAVVVASVGVQPRRFGNAVTLGAHHEHHDDHDDHQHHGHHRHGGIDPHAWQNPLHVVQYAHNIAEALSKVDPAGAAQYRRNAQSYEKELHALDAWIRDRLWTIPVAQRKVLTAHDAFGYFADRYQVTFLAPQGVLTDAEPSAKAVAQLIQRVRKEQIRAIFTENLDNSSLLRQIVAETGAKVLGSLYSDALSLPGTAGDTYLRMMRHNVDLLMQGLAR